jgi:hypothetical protein
MLYESYSQCFGIQPGRPRVLQETIEVIKMQYQLALDSEVASRLGKLQRDTGVKDPIAQPILEKIQARWAELLTPDSEGNTLSRQRATEIVQQEFDNSVLSLSMNPLLRMRGMCIASLAS